jgi:hypothetical protein
MDARDDPAWLRWLEAGALAAAGAIVLWALATGSARRHYDVDEIQHAHVMWRISAGDRPFHDFVESHPPFVWYLGAPLVGAASSAGGALLGLRVAASAAGLAFLGLVLVAARTGQPSLGAGWLAAAGLLVLAERRNLDYFIEARPDSVAYTLLFAAFVAFLRGGPRRPFARYATFAFLASTALLWTPKFALLVVAFAAADLVARRHEPRAVLVALLGHAAGVGLAVAAGLAFLAAVGIDPVLAYDLSIEFHRRFLATTAFSRGLEHSLAAQPVHLALAAGGVVCWLVLILTRRLRPAALEVAAAVFLIATPFLVRLPYKQYFAPWFALAAVFVPFLGRALRELGPRAARVALLALVVFIAYSAAHAGREYRRFDQVGFFHSAWQVMARVAPPDGRVVATPQWNPVRRRDVFYGWFSTFDPGGHDQEFILRRWNPKGYGARFTEEGYRKELAEHPPALIVAVGNGYGLPATQEQVVADYVRDHQGEYVRVPLAGTLAVLARRAVADWEYLESAGLARRP